MGGARAEQKTAVFPQFCMRTAWRKSFRASQWCRWKAYTPNGCILGSRPNRYQQPQMEEPKPEKFGFRKFVSSILRDVEKFAEFNGELFFQIRPKMAEILPENPSPGNDVSWHTKSTESAITPVVYNGSARSR